MPYCSEEATGNVKENDGRMRKAQENAMGRGTYMTSEITLWNLGKIIRLSGMSTERALTVLPGFSMEISSLCIASSRCTTVYVRFDRVQ